MAKFHRKAETAIHSFRRRTTKRVEPGAAILVVTEGVNTEPAYFQWIRERFAAPTVELVSHGAGRGDPRALVDEALRLKRERKQNMRERKLGINRLEDFDAVWIVFDTDVLQPQKIHDGIAYAKSKGIHIAYSEPCFEFWFLLHRRFTTAPMAKCADVIPFLKEFFGWENYSRVGKKQSEVLGLMEPLVTKELVKTAVAHAAQVRRYHLKGGTPFPANPSTDVDHLIRSIHEAVSPANKFLS